MSSNDSVNVKWNHKGTFRRFQIPRSGEIYASLLAKISAVVPNFAGKLAWKDEDGDQIVFSSNIELSEAVSLPINQNILRIFTIEATAEEEGTEATANKEKAEEKERHIGVTCDSCEVGLCGIRYKCAVCDDFDLCEKCEKKGLHAEHPLIRYASPRTPYLDDFMRRRRHCRRFGVHGSMRSPFMGDGLFSHCQQNATAAASAATRAAAMASQKAAHAATEHAARHAANVAAAFNKCPVINVPDGAPAADGSQQIRDSVAQGMEFLKEVGAQVQQALANFGIDVDVDVQNGGVTEKIPKTNEKAEEEKPTENKEKDKDAEKRKSDETLETTDQQKKDAEDVSVPMKKMHISEPTIDIAAMDTAAAPNDATAPPLSEETPILVDVDSEVLVDIHGDGDADSWTVMDSRETEQTPPAIVPVPPAAPQDPPTNQSSSIYPQLAQENSCQAGTPFVVPPPGQHNPHCFFIHPDQRVALCVSQLEGMGFDNCNGWLTKLSAMFNGNVLGVIEALGEDPVYAELLRKS